VTEIDGVGIYDAHPEFFDIDQVPTMGATLRLRAYPAALWGDGFDIDDAWYAANDGGGPTDDPRWVGDFEIPLCVSDCIDECTSDPTKDSPGACGCGVSDSDSDGDGIPDCFDGCPTDPDKCDPGFCGCNEPDRISDGDTLPACYDGCPMTPRKRRQASSSGRRFRWGWRLRL
jgi:hypothetical protein